VVSQAGQRQVASLALPAKCSPAPGTSISFETWLVLLPVTVTGEHGAFSNHEKAFQV
jgi:hypothetical protein